MASSRELAKTGAAMFRIEDPVPTMGCCQVTAVQHMWIESPFVNARNTPQGQWPTPITRAPIRVNGLRHRVVPEAGKSFEPTANATEAVFPD